LVFSRAGGAGRRDLDGQALLNLERMLEAVAQRLKELQSRAREAKRVADSLLAGPGG
jgi:uncharacterized membrane protein